MDGSPLLQSSHNEKLVTADKILADSPLKISSSLKLIADIITFSKLFIKPSPDRSLSENAVNALINEVLSLDIKRDITNETKQQMSTSYVTIAKADLFPNHMLTKEDREVLAKLGFIEISEQGQYISYFIKLQQIYQYITLHLHKKYQPIFKKLIDHAAMLVDIGFASYNLLLSRKSYDKNNPLTTTIFDTQSIISIEKNNIIKLIEEISKYKSNTTSSIDLLHFYKEIIADIDQIRYTYDDIELELLKKECFLKQQQIDGMIATIIKSNKTSILSELKLESNKIDLIMLTRKTKSKEQLLKLIDELELKHSYILTELSAQKKTLENSVLVSEKQIREINNYNINEAKIAEKKQLTLESNNQILNDKLQIANTTIQTLDNTIAHLKNHTPWWHYGLSGFGIAVGAILCASGVGLLASALAFGILTITLAAIIITGNISYIGYKIYKHTCFHSNEPPPPHVKSTQAIQMITLPPIQDQKSTSSTPRYSETLTISPTPLFNPRSPRAKNTNQPEQVMIQRP